MGEHLRALGVFSLLRSGLEVLLGVYLLAVVVRWSTGDPAGTPETWMAWLPTLDPSGDPEPGDRFAFALIGALLILVGLVRLVQSFSALLSARWARKAGIVLAVLDFATPITLPLAFWGLVVYRHPDTRDRFEKRPVS